MSHMLLTLGLLLQESIITQNQWDLDIMTPTFTSSTEPSMVSIEQGMPMTHIDTLTRTTTTTGILTEGEYIRVQPKIFIQVTLFTKIVWLPWNLHLHILILMQEELMTQILYTDQRPTVDCLLTKTPFIEDGIIKDIRTALADTIREGMIQETS